MGQVLKPEKFIVTKVSASEISLGAGSAVTIGGQQYTLSSSISLLLSGLTVNSLYMVYAVMSSGVMTLVASTNVNSVGPSGYSSWKLVSAFYADSTTALVDKLLPIDYVLPARVLGGIYYPSNTWSRTGTTYGALTGPSVTSIVDFNNQHIDVVSTTTTSIDLRIQNMIPGAYEISLTAPRVAFGAGPTVDGSLILYDGTNYLPFQTEGGLGGSSSLYSGATLVCPVNYLTAATRTFTVYGRVSASSIQIQAATADPATATGRSRLSMAAKYFPNFTKPFKDL
jgi:hypothetical protein